MSYQLRHALIIAIFIMGSYSIAKPFLADHHYRRALEIEGTQWPEAIVAYHKAIDLDPSNAEYHGKLAQLYLSRSRRLPAPKCGVHGERTTDNGKRSSSQQLAAACYQKAIELCPKNGNYWLGIGMVYEEMARCSRSTVNSQECPVYGQRSTVNGQQSSPHQLAASSYQKAVSLDPNNAFFRTMLGSFHIRNGNKEEGLEQYEKAFTSLPRLQLYGFLNNKDVKDEFLDAAIKGLKKAIELYPGDADIRSQLGGVYIKKGMYGEAIEQYEHALKLKPEHKGFTRTLASLRKQPTSLITQ